MKILGFNYELRYSGIVNESNSFGRYSVQTQKILIAEDLHPEQEISSILHEIIEVVNYHLELSIEHQAMMSLDAALFQVLRDSGVDLTPLLQELGDKKHG